MTSFDQPHANSPVLHFSSQSRLERRISVDFPRTLRKLFAELAE